MKALLLERQYADVRRAARGLRLVERPTPVPGPGQLLIRVAASPCNPSDLSFLTGNYEIERPLPTVPGFECSGVVVGGAGIAGTVLRGRRVVAAGQSTGDGAWAEYFVADAAGCIPLLPGVDFLQGSALVVNPMTAFGLLYRARRHGSKAIIQSAAASQLGRMIEALAKRQGLAVINVVRRKAQVAELRESGSRYVLDSSAKGFVSELTALAEMLGATTALDPVSGKETGLLLGAVPPGGQVIVFGGLSGDAPGGIENHDLVFRGKQVTGFHLRRHVAERGLLATLRDAWRVQRAVRSRVLHTTVRAAVPLADAPAAIAEYSKQMSAGKVFVEPWDTK